MLHVQAKVTRPDGTDLDANDPVGQVNNWFHSFFSQIDVYLNGTLMTPSNYPRRQMFYRSPSSATRTTAIDRANIG